MFDIKITYRGEYDEIEREGVLIKKLTHNSNDLALIFYPEWIVIDHLKSSNRLKQEIKCSRIIDFIRILYTVKETCGVWYGEYDTLTNPQIIGIVKEE